MGQLCVSAVTSSRLLWPRKAPISDLYIREASYSLVTPALYYVKHLIWNCRMLFKIYLSPKIWNWMTCYSEFCWFLFSGGIYWRLPYRWTTTLSVKVFITLGFYLGLQNVLQRNFNYQFFLSMGIFLSICLYIL